ncbi:hypothetical protein B0H66DRAFT_631837 [Apodospora peruviana]|uniref:Uncharacterized protein n=1 Tax=Apodospora peruviana TaxID=516989 RepID=A0AAE0LZ09_9PEZI|nr:hypothetical protein B0H66DRAFT_631837 [Apodospora peruviana]
MAGFLALDGLALIGTAITTVPVIQDLFNPKPDSSTTTKVRIIVGDADFAEGNEPHVSLFDRSGNNIGFTSDFRQFGDVINRGQPADIDVVQIDPGASANGAEYMALSASEGNAICISIVTVTTPTGIKYSFMGDIATQCGIPWFPGNVLASIGPKGEVRPNCVWIDGDGTNGINTHGLGMHLPSFQSNEDREQDFQEHPDRMCKSDPRFKAYDALTFTDSIPFFKEPVFDGTTLLDFDDKALDQSNWDQKPIDLSILGQRRRSYSYQKQQQYEQDGDARNVAATGTTTGTGTGTTNKKAVAGGNHRNETNTTTGTTATSSQESSATESAGDDKKKHGGGNNPDPNSNPKNMNPNEQDKGKNRKNKNWKMPGHLIVTPHASHNVQAVCKSRSSMGPDIVNPKEGWYCDMETKTLWEVCKTSKQGACFDVDTNRMRMGKGNSRRDEKSGRVIPRKEYTTVKQWK